MSRKQPTAFLDAASIARRAAALRLVADVVQSMDIPLKPVSRAEALRRLEVGLLTVAGTDRAAQRSVRKALAHISGARGQ